MTITVKLDAALEQQLRRRAASTGKSASDVIRAALVAYLEERDDGGMGTSAYDLGRDLFGRFGADEDLARNRKRHLAELWHSKRRAGRR